jgi:hypothetical protein
VLQMTADLKFSNAVFGFGAGIFRWLLSAPDSGNDARRALERAKFIGTTRDARADR